MKWHTRTIILFWPITLIILFYRSVIFTRALKYQDYHHRYDYYSHYDYHYVFIAKCLKLYRFKSSLYLKFLICGKESGTGNGIGCAHLLPQYEYYYYLSWGRISAATGKTIGKPLVTTYIRPELALVTAFAVL